jgi:tetratricopeptide (TPR) repeat protein
MQIEPLIRRLWLSTTLLWVGAFAAAQEAEPVAEEEEELQEIRIDHYADDEVPEEIENGDLVFDEQSQSYRLIEDDSGDDYVEPASEREQQTEELKRLFDLYSEALRNRDYLEADTLAKRVVELSIRINGLDSHDSAKAVTNLGIAQHHNGDYEAALQNFQSSIAIIERIDDNLSPALINPLRGLAATQAAVGRPDLAGLSFRRAVHVSHVNDGPHNKDQIEVLESMAELQISLGNYEDAIDIQQHIYSIQSRNVDPKSMDMIPALKKRARWQHRLQQYHSERVTWRRVIDIIEDFEGKDSLSLIAPLTELGKSYLFISPAEFDYQPEVSASSGESYMRRADSIAEENPAATWEIREGTLLSLGDYYILSGRPNRAEKTYQEAWEVLSEGDVSERIKARDDHLGKVRMLQRVYPPRYYNTEQAASGAPPPGTFETGTMSFSFTVATTGRVTNLRHLETQPRELEEFSQVVGRSLRRLIYRPRLEGLEMVPTPNVIYTHEFFYRPGDLPELPSETDAEVVTDTEDRGEE